MKIMKWQHSEENNVLLLFTKTGSYSRGSIRSAQKIKLRLKNMNLPNKIISYYPLLPLFDYVLNVVFGRGQVGHVQYIKPVPHLCSFYNDSMHFWS